ncbi:DUF742 domain-containing protein [Nocardia sp. NBC_00416]|uniref:DUF742 domain-containing protein n=1 Tax=Nocardia sp. NBC_00416 TaxID=2975991 RepID=UPI002E203AF0
MNRPGRDEDPDRFYTLTGGRTDPATEEFDPVTLVVSESVPAAAMQHEHVAILTMCRQPTAVVEIAAELRLPIGIATVLVADLLHAGKVTVRHPDLDTGPYGDTFDIDMLEKVLGGLRSL